MMDLFARLEPTCGECRQLNPKPLDSGVRYCWGEMTWRRPEERVLGCVYRERPSLKQVRDGCSRVEALTDLLESPRHSIDAKGRKWLRAELRAALRDAPAPTNVAAKPHTTESGQLGPGTKSPPERLTASGRRSRS